jgi:hypothetical protein
MKNILLIFLKNWFLVILVLVVVGLRIPSLFEPNRYADEDIYLTLGQGLRQGLVFYKDIHDNKPPLLYVVAGIAGSLFWFKFILLAVHAFSLIVFNKFSNLIFPKQKWLSCLSTVIYGLGSTLPPLEGNIANGENFMIVPAMFGAYLLYKLIIDKSSGSAFKYLIVGGSFSIAFLFKIPIAFDFAGLMLFLGLFSTNENIGKKIINLWSPKFIWLNLGFFGPIVISLVYYTLAGAFEPYFRSALLQNIGYLSSWGENTQGSIFNNPLIYRGIVVLIYLAIMSIFLKRIELASRMVIVWSIFSLYGALLSNRPYPHYLLQPLVPFSLLCSLFILNLFNKKWITTVIILSTFFVGIAAYKMIDFWKYDTFSYYNNFFAYASGNKSWEEYVNYWHALRNYQVAEYIRERTGLNDRIFVWGTEPEIYSLSYRLPIGKYTVSYHIVEFNAYKQTMDAIRATNPTYIVIIDDSPQFDELMSFISQNYTIEKAIDGATLYVKK